MLQGYFLGQDRESIPHAWPYLSFPESPGVKGGSCVARLCGLLCMLCPGEVWLAGCDGAPPSAAVPLRLK